jgi:predicted HTH domain antitoxin
LQFSHIFSVERTIGVEIMVQIAFEVPESVLGTMRMDTRAFTRDLRLAAAVKWYERRIISQGRAAEIAGVSRVEFIDALNRLGVTPFQTDADELVREARSE